MVYHNASLIMRIEIDQGIGIHISEAEIGILRRLNAGQQTQELFTDDEIKLLNRLINKNVVRRRNLGSKVFYEARFKSIG